MVKNNNVNHMRLIVSIIVAVFIILGGFGSFAFSFFASSDRVAAIEKRQDLADERFRVIEEKIDELPQRIIDLLRGDR